MFIKLTTLQGSPILINTKDIYRVTVPSEKFVIDGVQFQNPVLVTLNGRDGLIFVREPFYEVQRLIAPPSMVRRVTFELWRLWDYYRP
jgi:hypothetical protein